MHLYLNWVLRYGASVYQTLPSDVVFGWLDVQLTRRARFLDGEMSNLWCVCSGLYGLNCLGSQFLLNNLICLHYLGLKGFWSALVVVGDPPKYFWICSVHILSGSYSPTWSFGRGPPFFSTYTPVVYLAPFWIKVGVLGSSSTNREQCVPHLLHRHEPRLTGWSSKFPHVLVCFPYHNSLIIPQSQSLGDFLRHESSFYDDEILGVRFLWWWDAW